VIVKLFGIPQYIHTDVCAHNKIMYGSSEFAHVNIIWNLGVFLFLTPSKAYQFKQPLKYDAM